jgi:hypothetical protein
MESKRLESPSYPFEHFHITCRPKILTFRVSESPSILVSKSAPRHTSNHLTRPISNLVIIQGRFTPSIFHIISSFRT